MSDLSNENTQTTETGAGENGTGAQQQNAQGGNTQGNQQDDIPGWMKALPDELKTNETLRKFAKPGDFAKEALTWKDKAEKGIIRPSDKATAAELEAYRTAMGIPKTPDEYQFADEVDGIKMQPELLAEYRLLAHEKGIPADVANSLLVWQAKTAKAYIEKVVESNKKQIKDTEEVLQKEWGIDHVRNKELAERGFSSMPQKLQDKILKIPELINDPEWARYCKELGSKNSEDTMKDGNRMAAPAKSAAEKLYPTN